MVLRFFARMHGRLRRRFFRLNPLMRLMVACLFVGVVASGIELGLAWHYASVMPWYDRKSQLYLVLNDDHRLFEHNTVLATAIAQISDRNVDELAMAIDAIKSSQADEYRFTVQDGVLSLIAIGATQSAGIVPSGWQMAAVDKATSTIALSTGAMPNQHRWQWNWVSAMRLRALQVYFPVVFALQKPEWPLFYGALQVQDQGWDLFVAPSSAPIRHARLVQDSLMSSLVHVTSHGRLPQSALPAAITERITSPVWQFLFAVPFRLSVFEGDLLAAADPFAPGVSWQLALDTNAQAANVWLQTVLQTLMVQFPLAEQRVLPDKSIVYELKRKADFFVPPGMSVDLQSQSEGVFTFPHDQIAYRYDGTSLIASKGSVSDGARSLPSCQLQSAQAEFGLSSQVVGTTMWKTIYFGLDKEKMAACIRW